MEARSAAEAAGRAAGARATGGTGNKNNFPAYRGPIGTNNADTSSAGVSVGPRGVISTGKDTPWGTRIFDDGSGNKFARSPEWKDAVDKFNKAAKQWNDDRILNTAIRWALPFGLQNVAPRWDQPSTFADGTYHFGMNPAAAVGGVAGLFAGPAGPIVGPALGKAYDIAGGKNLVFGGPGAPDNNFTGGPKSLSSPQGPSPAPSGRTETSGVTVPGPMQAASPSIFNQPTQVAAQQPAPTIFPRPPANPYAANIPGGNPYSINLFGRAA